MVVFEGSRSPLGFVVASTPKDGGPKMTTPQRPRAHAPRATALLRQLADQLTDPAADSEGLPLPMVMGIDGDSEELEVTVAPPADDVYDNLLGLVAPAHWKALLIWVEGTAFRPDDAASREPVRVLLGLTRAGDTLSRLHNSQGAALPHSDDQAAEGLLLDCARRVFELPTPPPPVSTASLHCSLWFDAIIRVSLADPGGHLGWATVTALHPAGPDVVDDDPAALACAADRLAVATSWTSLRRTAGHGERPDLPVSPTDADWMDDGLFARWCLASLAEPAQALDELAEVVSPEVLAAIRQVTAASGC